MMVSESVGEVEQAARDLRQIHPRDGSGECDECRARNRGMVRGLLRL